MKNRSARCILLFIFCTAFGNILFAQSSEVSADLLAFNEKMNYPQGTEAKMLGGILELVIQVVEVYEDLKRLTDDVMRFTALNVNQEANAASVVFELWVVKALFARRNGPRPGASSPLLCLDAHRVIRAGDVITFRPKFELKVLYFLRSQAADAMFVFLGIGWFGFIRKPGKGGNHE